MITSRPTANKSQRHNNNNNMPSSQHRRTGSSSGISMVSSFRRSRQERRRSSTRSTFSGTSSTTGGDLSTLSATISSQSGGCQQSRTTTTPQEPLARTSSHSTTSNSSNPSTNKKPRRISRWALQEIATICNEQVQTPSLQSLPQVSFEELQFMGLLGQGGFASVHRVQYTGNNHKLLSGSTTTLAQKQIRLHKRGRNEEDWILAVFDLCNEAALLGRIGPHENIVELKGVCQQSVSEAYKTTAGGWFFLEEELEDTLADRLKVWRHQLEEQQQGGGGSSNNPEESRLRRAWRARRRHSLPTMLRGAAASTTAASSPPPEDLLSESSIHHRLQTVGLGIANAMKHLHSQDYQIVVRDLKPQNIGFSATDGKVKLFDLGMARPVQEVDALSHVAGTFRYIAPEILLGQGNKTSNLESDIYSFGIILYELATLSKPFEGEYFSKGKLIQRDAFYQQVIVEGQRPDLSHIQCKATARLISKCWDPSPRQRPSFEKIHSMLSFILENAAAAEAAKTATTMKDAASSTTSTDNNPSSTRLDMLRDSMARLEMGATPRISSGDEPSYSTTTSASLQKDDHRSGLLLSSRSDKESSKSSPNIGQHHKTPLHDGEDQDDDCNLPRIAKAKTTPSFQGLFRGLKPLSKLKSRVCSDTTVTMSSTTSGAMMMMGGSVDGDPLHE